MILLGFPYLPVLRSVLERCILEALLHRVLYCGHSTQYSHLVISLNQKKHLIITIIQLIITFRVTRKP